MSNVASYLLNKSLNTIGMNNLAKTISGDALPGEERILFESDKPCTISYLEWATNHQSAVDIRIIVDGLSVGTISLTQFQMTRNSPQNIVANGSEFFNIVEYSLNENKFKFNLKGKMTFPSGVKITLRNTSTSTRKAAAYVVGSEY